MFETLGHFNYWLVVVLMMTGMYVVIGHHNLIKKLIGLSVFQTSVFIFYISMGVVNDGAVPIVNAGADLYSNPLPHVLILTAIVVGVATSAVGLALVVRIRESYDTIEDDELNDRDVELDKEYVHEYN